MKQVKDSGMRGHYSSYGSKQSDECRKSLTITILAQIMLKRCLYCQICEKYWVLLASGTVVYVV